MFYLMVRACVYQSTPLTSVHRNFSVKILHWDLNAFPERSYYRHEGCFEYSEKEGLGMNLITVAIEKPEDINFVFGQTHFIKTVEDIHEALVSTVPGIKFGLAFCEASGKCLVRWSGTDHDMIELARKNAQKIGAGHSFIVFLGPGFFPVNVLNTLKMVPEVCRIFCATANPVEVIVVETELGRGVMGVIDGSSPKGIEAEEDINWRKELLRKIGYKL